MRKFLTSLAAVGLLIGAVLSAQAQQGAQRVGKTTGRTFVLNPDTGEVTIFD